MWNSSLRTRLTGIFIILAIGPLLIVGAIMAQRSFAVEREQALALQNQVAQRISAEVFGYFQDVENDLGSLAGELRGLEQPDRAQQLSILLSAFNAGAYRDAYEQFGWLDASGQEQIRVSRQEIFTSDQLRNRANEDVYLRPVEDGHTYFSSVWFDEVSGRDFVTIAIPVFEPRSVQLSGVLVTDLRFSVVSDLLARIRVGADQTAYVVDAEDRVVAHQEPAQVRADNQIDIPDAANFQPGLTQEAAVLGVDPIELGGQTFYAVAEIAQAEALALANSLLTALIVVSAIALAMAIGAGFVIVRNIIRPVEQLATTAGRITEGDFSQEAEVVRRDEIGTLATAFNNMTAQLRNLIGSLEQRVADRTHSLEQTAAALQTILDSVITPVVIARLSDASIAYVNEPASAALRESQEMLLHRPILDFYDDPVEAESFLESMRESGFITNYELRLKRSDGTSLWCLVSSNLMTYENESAFITTFIDITERKKQEEQAAFELRNQAVMNEIFQIASETDLDELLQRALDKILGLPWMPVQPQGGVFLTEPGKMALKLITHRNLAPQLQTMCALVPFGRCLCGRAAETKEIQFADCVNDDHDIRFEGMAPHGHYNVPLVTDNQQIVGVMVFYLEHGHQSSEHEISFLKSLGRNLANTIQRKQAEQQLQEEQARTQEILESLNVPLVISRVSDGIVAYVNEPMAEMIRVPRDELIGQVTPDFYHNPADREAYLRGLREQGYVSNFDLHLKRGDGDLLWTLVSGRIINFQGETAIISSLMDITDRREAEATIARRATELETVANVSTVAATILEPEDLLQQAVDLTKERFELYHAHLYLIDENQAHLVLANGAGEIGRKMVADGRQIALNQEQSLVARAARTHSGVVINNVQAEPGFLPHPLLPETRSEMAVPLIAGNEVLGVLDVQADEVDHFTSEEVNVFTTLASQIAVALQNARRHDEAQRALDELTRLQRIMVREGWEEYLTAQERPFKGYAFSARGTKPIQDESKVAAVPVDKPNGRKHKNKKSKQTAVATPDSSMAIPIAVRGETIGKIGLRNPDGSPIPERKQTLIKTVAHQVSEALERARLTEQTQRALQETNEQARRLALLNELSETISRIETLEEISVAVMNKVPDILKAKRLSLHLIAEKDETMLRVVGVAGEIANMPENEMVPLAESPMAQALEERQIVVGAFESGEDTLKAYFAPLYAGGRPLGTFNMVIPADKELDEGERQILLQIASLLGTTLENRRLFNQTKARADREQLLNSITQKIQSTVTMESALQTAVQELGAALKLRKAIVEVTTNENGNGRESGPKVANKNDHSDTGQTVERVKG